MAIPATEHCNPCENADFLGRPHPHPKGSMCNRRMYRGDFFCDCQGESVSDELEATRAKRKGPKSA